MSSGEPATWAERVRRAVQDPALAAELLARRASTTELREALGIPAPGPRPQASVAPAGPDTPAAYMARWWANRLRESNGRAATLGIDPVAEERITHFEQTLRSSVETQPAGRRGSARLSLHDVGHSLLAEVGDWSGIDDLARRAPGDAFTVASNLTVTVSQCSGTSTRTFELPAVRQVRSGLTQG